MKKYLLSALAVAAAAFMGMAQSTKPAAGEIDMAAYPGGIGSIEVEGNYEINTECTAFAQLYQNGVLLRQVPAYAGGDIVYTCEGYDKVPVGDIHITFYRQQICPAADFGVYKVIIPEGFGYEIAGGQKVPTKRIEKEFYIKKPSMTFTPSRGASVETIEKVYITLPEMCSDLTVNQVTVNAQLNTVDEEGNEKSENYSYSSYGYFSLPDESENGLAKDKTVLNAISAKVTGRVVELTFPATGGMNGSATFTIPAGVISFKVLEGGLAGSYKNSEDGYRLTMVSAVTVGESAITPAPGTYEGGIKSTLDITQTINVGKYNFFVLSVPEDAGGIQSVMPYRATAYKLNDDGTRGEQVAQFPGLQTSGTTVGLVAYNMSDRNSSTAFYPGPGKYEIVIPANFVYYKNGTRNPELTFGPYVFTAPQSEGDDNFTITPSTTSEIDYIKNVVVEFPEGTELVYNKTNYATLTNGYTTINMKPTNLTEENMGPGMFKLEGNTVNFELPVELNYAGEWTFAIPGETLKADGVYVTVNKTFTVKTPEKPVLEIQPSIADATVDKRWDEDYDMYVYDCVAHTLDDTVSFTFDIPSGFTEMYYMAYGTAAGYDTPTYRRIPVSDALASGMKQGNTITIDNGDDNLMYEIAFAIGEDIPEDARFVAYFTVDDTVGVQLIKANELVDVYSVTGAKVASKVDARILNQLPAGLYIINGKKVLVK